MSDRVAVMYLGKIVETAEVEDLFERPLHPYTQALIQAIPVPAPGARDGVDRKLKGDIPSPIAPPSGCRFHPRCPHAVDLCQQKEPLLEATGEGRFVACHRWRDLPQLGLTDRVSAVLTPGAERRVALYRERSAALAAAVGTAATITRDTGSMP